MVIMKIGINASFIRKASTGIGQVSINFLKELAQFPDDIEFVLYLEEDLPRGIKLPKNFTKNIFLPFWKRDDLLRKIWWEKYALPKKIKQDGCDVFLSLYQCPTVTTIGVKHIMLVHDIIPRLFPQYLNNPRKQIYWALTERAIGRADKVLVISSRTEKDLINQLGIDAQKITVNYIDVDEIYKKDIPANTISTVLKKYKLKPSYIYNGGGLEVRKNTEGVIRAYKYLLEKNSQEHFLQDFPKLVISGKLMPNLAPLVTDVTRLVRELNLTKNVVVLDFVPQKDLPTLYSQASVFVYPSHYEGFGLPVLEAMNVGTSVITSKKSSLPEVGLDSILYCNPNDVADIAMVMKNVLTNSELRATLIKRGKQRAEYFSWQKFTDKVMHVARNL